MSKFNVDDMSHLDMDFSKRTAEQLQTDLQIANSQFAYCLNRNGCEKALQQARDARAVILSELAKRKFSVISLQDFFLTLLTRDRLTAEQQTEFDKLNTCYANLVRAFHKFHGRNGDTAESVALFEVAKQDAGL